MKKNLAILQILVLLFFVLKIVASAGVLQQKEAAREQVDTAAPAAKNTYARRTDVQPSSVKGENGFTAESKKLLGAIEERQKALDQREASLKAEEQRLIALKNEILEKIGLLKAQQEKLDAALVNIKNADTKRYKDLAKVFDSIPPAKAGAMLEVMDTKTAAGITMNMKKDKAGALWGYLNPQKAIEITREITRLSNAE